MKVLALLIVVVTVAGCGQDEVPAPPPPTRPIEADIVCPVEGTRFQPSRGVEANVGTATIKVCSRGCAIRAEATPERFANQGK